MCMSDTTPYHTHLDNDISLHGMNGFRTILVTVEVNWVKGVSPQTEPQQPLHPSEGTPQGQVGSEKGEDPQSNLVLLQLAAL